MKRLLKEYLIFTAIYAGATIGQIWTENAFPGTWIETISILMWYVIIFSTIFYIMKR